METPETKSNATSDMGDTRKHQKQRVCVPQTRVETTETKSKGTSDMCGDVTNKEQPCVETSQNKELEVPEPCVGESETKRWRYLRYMWIGESQTRPHGGGI